jgi:phospholipase/carboxylesterase
MKTIRSTLVHRVAPPEGGVSERFPTLVLLHGRGADEEDLLGLSQYLDDRLLLIAPRAPFEYEIGGYTWYDLAEPGKPDHGRFSESFGMLSAFVDDIIREYPVDSNRLFLLGFSMGAVMSYALSLTRPRLFRGVSANSGYVPELDQLTLRWNDLASLNVFVTHGLADPIIPVSYARHARELFEKSNANLTYREYAMGHQFCEESLSDIVSWMSGLL